MTTTRRSNVAAGVRTTLLLGTLTGLFVVIGFAIGGAATALLFLFFGAAMNFGAFWFSDKIALKMSGAPAARGVAGTADLRDGSRPLRARTDADAGAVLIPQAQPNAFATGRSPNRAAVAVTAGITKLLSEDELRGVIAHELAHIQNRDTLIQSVAATIGGAITYLAYMLMWFGGNNDSPLGLIGSLADGPAGADRGDADPDVDQPPARVLGRRHRSGDLRSPREPRHGPAAARGGRQGHRRWRSTRRPSASTSSSRSRARASPVSSRRIRRSRNASAVCGRCGPASASQLARSPARRPRVGRYDPPLMSRLVRIKVALGRFRPLLVLRSLAHAKRMLRNRALYRRHGIDRGVFRTLASRDIPKDGHDQSRAALARSTRGAGSGRRRGGPGALSGADP